MKIQTCTGQYIEGATAKQLVAQLQQIQFGGIDEADIADYMNCFLERMCSGSPQTLHSTKQSLIYQLPVDFAVVAIVEIGILPLPMMMPERKKTNIDENGHYIVDEGGCFTNMVPDDVGAEYGKPVPPHEPGNVSPVQLRFQGMPDKKKKALRRK